MLLRGGIRSWPTAIPTKMAQAMIDCADRTSAPRRLVLGAGAYGLIRAALTRRLAELERQKDIALDGGPNG
jgi:hypothetical protein